MKLESLHDLFVHELRDLYDAEDRIIEALPEMEAAASTPEVKELFRNHLQETREQKGRLEQIFDRMGSSPKGVTCQGIKGIISEADDAISADCEPPVRDAALICGAQKVEHYEICSYGCACEFARQLGEDQAVELLTRTLEEEKKADQLLSAVAESGINQAATVAKAKS